MIGAYRLAEALKATGGDHERAFAQYERAMAELVARSRTIAHTTMKTLIPATPRQVWLTIQSMRLIPRLPTTIQRRLFAVHGTPATALESVTINNHPENRHPAATPEWAAARRRSGRQTASHPGDATAPGVRPSRR